MQKAKLVWLFLLGVCHSYAQTDDARAGKYPEERLQVGFYFGDFLFRGDLTFDVNYRFAANHALGAAFGYIDDRNDFYEINGEDFWRGTDARLYHLIYLGSTVNENYFFLRHGARLVEGNFRYSVFDFFPYQENGNTYIKKQNRDFYQPSLQFSYELVFGFQWKINRFFSDYYLGANLSHVQHNNLHGLNGESYGNTDPRYSGLRPLAGMRMGFYLD